MKVHWTDHAKVRLRLLHSYIAAEAPLVANEVVERLLRRSLQIGELPYAGAKFPNTGARMCAKH